MKTVKEPSKTYKKKLYEGLRAILGQGALPFNALRPGTLSEAGGIYLITDMKGRNEKPLYVGLSKNLRGRIYTQLTGNASASRVKARMVESHMAKDLEEARKILLELCGVRWIKKSHPKQRMALEHYFIAVLSPKLNFGSEEKESET